MKYFLLLCGLYLWCGLSAQSSSLQITVRDSANQAVLAYANVFLPASGIGKKTNENGQARFSAAKLKLPDTLIVSYIGYRTQKILLTQPRNIEVSLASSAYLLDEVVIASEKPMKAEQIVRKAIRKVPQNYPQQDAILKGLYRETVQENGRYIQLNEAIAELYYTSYPQKRMSPKIWERWYENDEYAFDLEADRQLFTFFIDYNTERDQMRILQARASENWSEAEIETALMGGPLSLTSYDKVKYGFDFLNPRLIGKYEYKLEGKTLYQGKACYLISFLPKGKIRRFVSDLSKKNKHPIYVGQMYVEMENFAVVRFDYSLAIDKDYGFHAHRIPLAYEVSVRFAQRQGLWQLAEVEAMERKAMGRSASDVPVIHEGRKQLLIDMYQNGAVRPFADSSIYHHTRWSAIRYYYDPYDSLAWEQEQSILDRFPLPSRVAVELSEAKPLALQYAVPYQTQENLAAPNLRREYYRHDYPLGGLTDSLHWVIKPSAKAEFRDYLLAENRYAKAQLRQNRAYRKGLYDDMRLFWRKDKQAEKPPKPGEWRYGQDSLGLTVLYRYQDSVQGEAMFHLSALQTKAKTRVLRVLPNKDKTYILAYGERPQQIGGTIYIFRSGEKAVLDSIPSVYSFEWFDAEHVLYSQSDAKGGGDKLMLRSTLEAKTQTLYEEKDVRFDVEVYRQAKVLQCGLVSKSETEIYLMQGPAAQPEMYLVQARKSEVSYHLLGKPGNWFMLSNEDAPGNQIWRSTKSLPTDWQLYLPAKRKVFIDEVVVSDDYLAYKSYHNAEPQLHYRSLKGEKWRNVKLPHKYCVFSMGFADSASSKLRLELSAPDILPQLIEVDLLSNQQRVLSTPKVSRPDWAYYQYVRRKWARSEDGTKVPMTIIRSVNRRREHQGCVLKVYGAYGSITQPPFSLEDVILTQQGYTVVYAHVRGESILGYDWYRQGKGLQKGNSFADFIACARYLIDEKISSPDQLVAYGNSAGGMIVGWAANEHPELFNSVILDHPFVDVLHTVMNDSLPLTQDEYKEWGDPREEGVFDYIQSYCPYLNVKSQAYPHMLFQAGWYDFQTPAWQIARVHAAIRRANQADTEILLQTEMNSGHAGSYDQQSRYKSLAETIAWLNRNLGLLEGD